MYESQGRYGEAEPLYKEALHLSEKVLGKEHPDTLISQSNYIGLLINMKQTRTAFRLLKNRENLLFSRSFQELYSTSTERVRRLYLQNISNFQDLTFSFALAYPEPEHQVYAANVLLRWKQVYAEESAFQHRLMNLSKDPEVVTLRERVSGLRADLSRKIRNPQFQKDIAEIWHNLTLAENEIRERAKKFKPELEVSGARLDQIAGLLPKDSALIEFRLFYPRELKTGEAGKPHFAASFVLSDIEAEQQIAFEDVGAVEDFVKALEDSEKKPEKLYEYLLGRFDSRIKDLKKLYISPDGNLSLISFASLRLTYGRYLTERQQVATLQTGRDLKVSPAKPLSNLLIAFGGVDYGEYVSDKTTKKEDREELKHTNLRAARELDGMKYLKNSLYEAELVKEIFITHSKDGKAIVYKKGEATEKRLKNLDQPPRILHLSTHGFYLQDADGEGWTEEAPLLLSGLALAGANRGLKGMVDDNGDDGLLYSIEVTGLNLQGTELVSLSACDTGKGVIDYSEGVYGLVRAFRTAGAQNVLMTLWPVGDRSSRDFMERFYDIWLGDKDNPTPSEALHRTRLEFINHKKENYRDPNVWAPYVLVGQ